MALNFSEEEQGLIDAQKLTDEALPSYYSASQKNFVQIGRDFESYLILQSTEQKQKMLSWLDEAGNIQEDQKDRDELLTRFLNNRNADAAKRIEELDEMLNGFNEFIANLFKDGEDASRWTTLSELASLNEVLQKPIDEFVLMREQSFHEQNLTSLMLENTEELKTSSDTERELNSWRSVIATYPGRETSEPSNPVSSLTGGLL